MMNEIRYEFAVYTDGSCKGNGSSNSSMAFGYRFTELATGNQREDSGPLGPGTSNLAELMAIKKAFEGIENYCKDKNYPLNSCSVMVYSDSQFAVEVLKGNYKTKHHSEVVFLLKSLVHKWGQITYIKVSGHSGHKGNEYADSLAQNAHPKKRSLILRKTVEATESDVFDLLESCANEAVNWHGASKSFVLKRGKNYEVSFIVKEV